MQVLAPHLGRVLQKRPLLDLDPLRVYKQLDIEHDPQVKTRDQMMGIPEVQKEIAKRCYHCRYCAIYISHFLILKMLIHFILYKF